MKHYPEKLILFIICNLSGWLKLNIILINKPKGLFLCSHAIIFIGGKMDLIKVKNKKTQVSKNVYNYLNRILFTYLITKIIILMLKIMKKY